MLRIGRRSESDGQPNMTNLVLNADTSKYKDLLSRTHADLWLENGAVMFADGGRNNNRAATNGSAVDGILVPRSGTVRLEIGQTVEFGAPHLVRVHATRPDEFVYRLAPVTAAPPPEFSEASALGSASGAAGIGVANGSEPCGVPCAGHAPTGAGSSSADSGLASDSGPCQAPAAEAQAPSGACVSSAGTGLTNRKARAPRGESVGAQALAQAEAPAPSGAQVSSGKPKARASSGVRRGKALAPGGAGDAPAPYGTQVSSGPCTGFRIKVTLPPPGALAPAESGEAPAPTGARATARSGKARASRRAHTSAVAVEAPGPSGSEASIPRGAAAEAIPVGTPAAAIPGGAPDAEIPWGAAVEAAGAGKARVPRRAHTPAVASSSSEGAAGASMPPPSVPPHQTSNTPLPSSPQTIPPPAPFPPTVPAPRSAPRQTVAPPACSRPRLCDLPPLSAPQGPDESPYVAYISAPPRPDHLPPPKAHALSGGLLSLLHHAMPPGEESQSQVHRTNYVSY